MNCGQPPGKIQVNPSAEFKTNSSAERPTLQVKIKANSSTES